MQAEETLARIHGRTQFVQRNAGGVGREQRARLHRRFGLAIQLLLGFEIFEDRLDDEIGIGDALAVDIGLQFRRHRRDALRRFQAFGEQFLRAIQRRLDELHLAILQRDVEAAQCAPRGNIAAHHAGADHVHTLNLRVAAGTEAFQPFLQKVYAHEIAAGRCQREPGDRARFELQALDNARPAAAPDFDQRERCGILIGPHLGCRLLAHDRREYLPHRPQVRRPRRGSLHEGAHTRMRDQFPRCGDQQFGRTQNVDDAERLGGFGRQRPAGQHDRQGFRSADQARQARGAAPAGMDAEIDFGQTDFRGRVAGCDAVAAGERQFRAAAHAEAVDRRHGRAAQTCKVLQHALTVLDAGEHAALFFVGFELADIRAGDKTVCLARADDHALGRLERQALDDLRQFVEHGAIDGVDRRVRAVEGQNRDAVGAGVGLPVGKA